MTVDDIADQLYSVAALSNGAYREIEFYTDAIHRVVAAFITTHYMLYDGMLSEGWYWMPEKGLRFYCSTNELVADISSAVYTAKYSFKYSRSL